MLVEEVTRAILLRDIALLTEYRNAGIGSRLIQDLMKEAAAAGNRSNCTSWPYLPPCGCTSVWDSVEAAQDAALEMKWVPNVGSLFGNEMGSC